VPRTILLVLALFLGLTGPGQASGGNGRRVAPPRHEIHRASRGMSAARRARLLRAPIGRTQLRRKANILASHSFHQQADASEIVRSLADGNPQGFWKLGIKPPRNFDSQMVEWAVIRDPSGDFRIMRGAKYFVQPRRFNMEIVEHSHPYDMLLSRPMTVEQVLVGSESNQLTPSAHGGDLDLMIEWGQKQHTIHMGVVLREDGRIGNSMTRGGRRVVNKDGSLPATITLHLSNPKREVFREPTRRKDGVWVYQVDADYRAEGKTVWKGRTFIVNGKDGYKVTLDPKDAETVRAYGRSLARPVATPSTGG
jgi:hypothetical protein